MKARLRTVKQVAEEYQLSERHVRQMAREGSLPSVRLGPYWRFDERRLEEVLASGGTQRKS